MRSLILGLALALGAGCGFSPGDMEGTWNVSSWSVSITVSGRTVHDATVNDAGTLRFDGDGTEFESTVLYDSLDLIETDVDTWTAFRRLARPYWRLSDDALFFGWNGGIDSERIEISVLDDSRFEGASVTTTALFGFVREDRRSYILVRP